MGTAIHKGADDRVCHYDKNDSSTDVFSPCGKHVGRTIVLILMIAIFLGGLVYALYPIMTGLTLMHEARTVSENFIRTLPGNQPSATESPSDTGDGVTDELPADTPYPELLAAMQAYNERIFAEGQAGLVDAWSYEAPSFDLTEYGIEDDVIGVLSIPSINLQMPIYLGATYGHMAAGAAHLSQTSLPIGGVNTNCVIAGHRGWSGAPYFLNMDKVEVGDTVTVTNLWETLTYEVCETRVIEPNDIDAVLIQPGRDMLTLITCHPYASGGRYRLVIYCERAETEREP